MKINAKCKFPYTKCFAFYLPANPDRILSRFAGGCFPNSHSRISICTNANLVLRFISPRIQIGSYLDSLGDVLEMRIFEFRFVQMPIRVLPFISPRI